MDISIIIVNWNVRDFLRDCLQSIYDHTKNISFEIIVVDNASTDGSVNMLTSDFPSVQTIALQKNIGFGNANNLAAQYATGKYIAVLNPDTILLNDAFGLMHADLEKDRKIGIIGPKLLSRDGKVQKLCARRFNMLSNAFDGLLFPRKQGKSIGKFYSPEVYENRQQIECLSGACFVIRKEVIKKNLIFDPQFFMYGEDVDLCFEANRNGWLVFYDGNALVRHFGGESSKQSLFDTSQYEYVAIKRLIKKHYGAGFAIAYQIVYMLSLATKFLIIKLMSILPSKRHDQFWIRRNQIYSSALKKMLKPEKEVEILVDGTDAVE